MTRATDTTMPVGTHTGSGWSQYSIICDEEALIWSHLFTYEESTIACWHRILSPVSGVNVGRYVLRYPSARIVVLVDRPKQTALVRRRGGAS